MMSMRALASMALGVASVVGGTALVTPRGAVAVAAQAADLDQLIAQVGKYKLGESRAALEAVAQQVVKAQLDPAARSAIANKLAAMLKGEATADAKEFACRQLLIIAGPEQVPALASLLADEKLAHMGRHVLEGMADPAADAALREALGTTRGMTLVGVVNSIGNRRDAVATGRLAEMLGGDDAVLAAASAASLGKIATPQAIASLRSQRNATTENVKAAIADALICAGDQLLAAGKNKEAAELFGELYGDEQPVRVRVAALRGIAAAAPEKAMPMVVEILKAESHPVAPAVYGFVRQLGGEEATRAFAGALPKMRPMAQALLIDALAARRDLAARPAVVAMLDSADENVRIAAIKAMGVLGLASDVPALASRTVKGNEGAAARDALSQMGGTGVQAAIVRQIGEANPAERLELTKVLARRGSQSLPVLLDIAGEDADRNVRTEAIRGAGPLASGKDLARFVQLLMKARSDGEREAAGEAIGALAGRLPDRDAAADAIASAMAGAPASTRAACIEVLGRIGGARALATVRSALADKDDAVSGAAVRAVTGWPDGSAIPDMLALAGSNNQTYRVLSLRGLVRVLNGGGQSAAEAVKIYAQMLAAARNTDETRLVLGGIGEVKSGAAAELIVPLLAEDALRNEAATAIVKIARASKGPRVKEALAKVAADVRVDAAIRKQAEEAGKQGN